MQFQKTSLAHNNPGSDDQSFNYWKNRRVCVTGGAGFLGSFLIEKLHAHGADQIYVPLEEEFDLTQPGTPQHVLEISNPFISASNSIS